MLQLKCKSISNLISTYWDYFCPNFLPHTGGRGSVLIITVVLWLLTGRDVCQDQRRLNPKIVSRLSVFVLVVLQVSQGSLGSLGSLGEKVIRLTHLTPSHWSQTRENTQPTSCDVQTSRLAEKICKLHLSLCLPVFQDQNRSRNVKERGIYWMASKIEKHSIWDKYTWNSFNNWQRHWHLTIYCRDL